MELSALAQESTNGVDLRVDASYEAEPVCPGSIYPETVVVHVQLRPRRPATRRCLAALAALGARHELVSFALAGLSGDDRVVRITVGVELGPRELIAKFSEQAQAAYLFVDGLFTDLYDYMPVYVGEPTPVERAAAAGVLEAAEPPAATPRIPSPRHPSDVVGAAPVAGRRGVPVLV